MRRGRARRAAAAPISRMDGWAAVGAHIMRVSTPFFISPAYCVPRITISPRPKWMSTEHDDVIPSVYLK